MWNRLVKSVTGVIPEEFMDPSHLAEVITYLKLAPIPGDDKLTYLLVWARQVGAKVSASQRNAVLATGIEAGGGQNAV